MSYIQLQWEQANWNNYILRKNYRLTDVIEGKVEGRTEVTGKQAGRRK